MSLRQEFRSNLKFDCQLDLLFKDNDQDYILWLENKIKDYRIEINRIDSYLDVVKTGIVNKLVDNGIKEANDNWNE